MATSQSKLHQILACSVILFELGSKQRPVCVSSTTHNTVTSNRTKFYCILMLQSRQDVQFLHWFIVVITLNCVISIDSSFLFEIEFCMCEKLLIV